MLKWALIIIGAFVGLVVLLWIIGLMIPKKHTATRAARFQQSPEQIFRVISDFANAASWRGGIAKIERQPDINGHPAWREFRGRGQGDSMTMEITELDPPRKMATRIADKNLPFGGNWTYEITPTASGGSVLRITENGEIYNPIFRVMARFVFGYSSTMEHYLKALGRKFGQDAVIEN